MRAISSSATRDILAKHVLIPTDHVLLEGALEVLRNAQGIVIFAHGSGSSRHSPRNQFVASGEEVTQLLALAHTPLLSSTGR